MNKAVAFAMCLFSSSFLLGSYDCSAATIVSASQQTPSDEEGDTETPKTFTTGDNTVTLTKSEDGKTLTVSGKGDLTKIEPAYKFVSTLPTDVFKNDDNHTKVAANADYSSDVTYQTRAAVYTKIDDFATTYTEKRTHYYFTEAGAKKYYTRKQTSWGDNPTFEYTLVNKGDEINKTEYVEDGTKTAYFTKNEGETEGYTRVDQLSTITNNTTEAESKEITHLKGMTDVFYSSDATTYHQAYNDGVYDENTTYYKRSWTYTTITFDALLSGGYLTNESALIKALWANNACEAVKFVNTDATQPLYIDNDIVKAILYYQVKNDYYTYYNVNTSITTLDLGAATCKNFTTTTFQNTLGAGSGTLKLATITIPLSEDKTVPSLVIESIREANQQAIVKSVTVPEGYTAVGDNAFKDAGKVETITLPNGITTIGKSAFYATNIASWELPTSLVTIGDDAFNSCKTTTSVTFPASLRTIGKGAFAQCEKLDAINLNDGLEIIGNSAFYLAAKNDNSKVLSIPASVKYVGPAAFNFRWYSDVYYYGEKAPLSPYGVSYINADVSSSAFGSQLLCGNGGFQPMAHEGTTAGDISTGYANRENYINGETYIAVLHFRGDISDKNAETFTDITRKYERWLTEKKNSDGTGTGTYYWYKEDHKTVGSEETAPSFNNYGPGVAKVITPGFQDTALGEQLIWPSQAQFMRSYAVNSNGVKWDGVTLYDSDLTDDDVKLIHEQEQGVNKSTLAEADKTALNKVAYLGTRQFVLISRDVKGDKKDEYPIDITEGKRWWTLCVPCDLTKAQVDEIFGENTHLCLFSKVVRKVDQTNGNEIHLFFQNDTYKNHYERANTGKWTKGAAVSGDDEVVLYAHTPYMIYPTKTPEKEFNGKKVFILTNYTIQSGGALPTVVTSVSGADEDPESYQAVNYVFVGNYRSRINANEDGSVDDASTEIEAQPVTIPQYSYVFGKKGNGNSQFWFYTGTKGTWGVNKCLVEREDDQNNMQEYTTFFGGSSSTSNVSQASFFGDDDVTAIDRVIYHYGDQSTAAIYNINGQMVRADGDRTGLAKGLYIQGGRKFVVR